MRRAEAEFTMKVRGMTEDQARLMTALGQAEDEAWEVLDQKVRTAMTAAGEDPDGPLLSLRMQQVASALTSRARREWDAACLQHQIKGA